MADSPQTTSDSGIPRFLRLLTTPALPELSDVAQQLRDSSLNNMRQAAGPEAAGRSFLQKALSGASSVGQTALAGAADVGAGLTPSDLLAGGLGGKIAGPYYAAKGAIGSLGSVQKATQEPSPENVQRALTDLSMTFLGAHSGVKAHLGAEAPAAEATEAPASEAAAAPPTIPGLMNHAQNVTDLAAKNGGATYSLKSGDRSGQNQYAVALMPERNRSLPGKVTPDSVAQYINDNADILTQHPNANVGVWNAPDNTHQLEISGTTHDLDNATDVAKKYNQYSIYDLKNGREIPVGGSGDNSDVAGQSVDAGERLSELTPTPDKEFMTLRHYSETPVKDGVLSGARRGIGANGSTIRNVGAEGTRVSLGDAPQGVYFYKDGGQGEPSIVSRPNEYGTQGHYALADLSDNAIFHDAVQKTFDDVKQNQSSIPGLSPQQAPVSDAEASARAVNAGEKALQAAGYDGYTNTSGDVHNQNIVFLFGDHKVSKVVPDNVAPKRIISGPMLSNPQAGATVMPASIISKVLPKSSDARAQSLITKAGANYQGPWGFAESGQPEQYAFTDPATGNTLALGEKELNKDAVAEKLAQSRLGMLNDEEKSRIGPRQIKQFSDIMMSLPKLQEMEDITKAGMVAKDWYPNARAAFHQLGNVAPDYFRPGDEIKFANVIGSTSPNQAVEMNLREGIGVWKRWVDAGRPTDVKSVTKLLDKIPDSDLTSAASKVPNLVSSLIGQDLFTGRKQYFKAPSFGQALGGNPNAKTPIDETFVGDTHVADMYGVKPQQVFRNAQLYYALAAHTRAVARKLNLPTDAAQASMWAATLAVKNAIGENPEATPSEIATMVTPERIAADSKDMADILLHDSVSRNLIKSMLPEGKTLDDFDEGLRQIVKGRPVDATGQGTIAAGGVTALAAKLKGKTNQATSVSYPKPLDTPLPERQLTGNYDDPIALAVNSGEMKDGKYVSTPNPLVTAEKQMYVKVESTFGPEVAQLLQDSVLDRTYNRHTAPADAGADVTNAAGQQFIDEAKALIASDGRSGIPTPKPETYYHGTDSDNVNSILRQGILAKHTGDSQGDVSNRSWRYSSEDEPYNGSVFLTKAFDEAARFSHKGTVLELSVPHSLYRQFDSDDVGDELFNGDVPAQHIVARHDYNNGKWQQQEITPPNVSGTNKGLEALAARLKGNDKVKRGKMTFK